MNPAPVAVERNISTVVAKKALVQRRKKRK